MSNIYDSIAQVGAKMQIATGDEHVCHLSVPLNLYGVMRRELSRKHMMVSAKGENRITFLSQGLEIHIYPDIYFKDPVIYGSLTEKRKEGYACEDDSPTLAAGLFAKIKRLAALCGLPFTAKSK